MAIRIDPPRRPPAHCLTPWGPPPRLARALTGLFVRALFEWGKSRKLAPGVHISHNPRGAGVLGLLRGCCGFQVKGTDVCAIVDYSCTGTRPNAQSTPACVHNSCNRQDSYVT